MIIHKRRQKESGFTLVELLVVLAIFGVLLTGVLKVFDVSNFSYMVQEEVAAMQQNVRVGKMFLERDVRMAGCGLQEFSMGDERIYALIFEDGGTTGSDKLTINYINYDLGACGTDPGGAVDSCDELPTLTLKSQMPLNSSEAEVNEDLESAPYSDWDEDCYCNGTIYTQPQPGFAIIITAPDGSKSDVVFITGVQPHSDKIQNGPNFTDDDGETYENKVLNSYPEGSTISFFNRNQFAEVVYELVGGILMRNSEPIAEDIDDLQFSFGLDTTADGFVDSWISDAALTDVQKDQVRLVKISILGRTRSEHRDYSNNRPQIENHTASATSDGYRRKLLDVTIKVRNLGL